jgi:hypothetical protein
VIRIALPLVWAQALGSLSNAASPDLTALLNEWCALLDPVADLRAGADDVLAATGWDIAGNAAVSSTTLRLLREAAKDADVTRALGASRDFSSYVEDNRVTGSRAMSVLAGLAVVASVRAGVGREAGLVRKKLKARRKSMGETRAPGAASEAPAEPGGGDDGRPALAPLPANLSDPNPGT